MLDASKIRIGNIASLTRLKEASILSVLISVLQVYFEQLESLNEHIFYCVHDHTRISSNSTWLVTSRLDTTRHDSSPLHYVGSRAFSVAGPQVWNCAAYCWTPEPVVKALETGLHGALTTEW